MRNPRPKGRREGAGWEENEDLEDASAVVIQIVGVNLITTSTNGLTIDIIDYGLSIGELSSFMALIQVCDIL